MKNRARHSSGKRMSRNAGSTILFLFFSLQNSTRPRLSPNVKHIVSYNLITQQPNSPSNNNLTQPNSLTRLKINLIKAKSGIGICMYMPSSPLITRQTMVQFLVISWKYCPYDAIVTIFSSITKRKYLYSFISIVHKY